jgi:hypothetical protein
MAPITKPITQYDARALTVRVDKAHDRAVITFIPQGQPAVSIRLPLAALDRFIVQASGELGAARSGDAS